MLSHLYRYQETYWTENKISLFLSRHPITKETPKGYWIDMYGYGTKRFVLKDARKKYACETPELALESYHARKKRQVRILAYQLDGARAALRLVAENQFEYIISTSEVLMNE